MRKGTALLLACLAGCVSTAESEKAVDGLWSRAQDQISKRDYRGAKSTLSTLLERFPDQEERDVWLLLLAGCEQQLGNAERATEIRERVAKEGRLADTKAQALAELGAAALKRGAYDEAAARFLAGTEVTADADVQARCFYFRGIALQRAGRFAEGRTAHQRAINLAPRSNEADRAREYLVYPDHFFVQTGAFREAAKADRQKETLAAKGFPAEVAAVDRVGAKLYCVRLGRFPSRAEAVSLRDRVVASKALPEAARIVVRP